MSAVGRDKHPAEGHASVKQTFPTRLGQACAPLAFDRKRGIRLPRKRASERANAACEPLAAFTIMLAACAKVNLAIIDSRGATASSGHGMTSTRLISDNFAMSLQLPTPIRFSRVRDASLNARLGWILYEFSCEI